MEQPWTQDNKKRNSGNTALLQVRVEELAVFQIIKVFFSCVPNLPLSYKVRHKVCPIKKYHWLICIFPSLPSICSQLHSITQRTNDFSDIYCFHVARLPKTPFLVKQFNLMTFTVATVFACQQLVNGHV